MYNYFTHLSNNNDKNMSISNDNDKNTSINEYKK